MTSALAQIKRTVENALGVKMRRARGVGGSAVEASVDVADVSGVDEIAQCVIAACGVALTREQHASRFRAPVTYHGFIDDVSVSVSGPHHVIVSAADEDRRATVASVVIADASQSASVRVDENQNMKISVKQLVSLIREAAHRVQGPYIVYRGNAFRDGGRLFLRSDRRRWTRDKAQAERFATFLDAQRAADSTEFNCGVENLAGER